MNSKPIVIKGKETEREKKTSVREWKRVCLFVVVVVVVMVIVLLVVIVAFSPPSISDNRLCFDA